MRGPSWIPHGFRNDHAGPLNAKVHRMLVGIYDHDTVAEALVELLRSDEGFDVHVRAALADALEAELKGVTNALRFRLIRPDGGARTWETTIRTMSEMQLISDRFKALQATGLTRKQAIGQLEDQGMGKRSKIEEALAYGRKAIVRVTRSSPTKSETSSD